MSMGFYKALEDKFRGSHQLIKSRLEFYLPFILPLKKIYGDAPVLDLGCGRGEWLDLMTEKGFIAQGVDLDENMLDVARQLGFNVHLGDAVAFLKTIPDESQVVVSAFHLVEHIPFMDLQRIVEESLRVLRPGGLLIMETPNPENIVVGTSNFYMDPTHNRPIPPALLAFIPEYYQYQRIKIVRLQESKDLISSTNINLFNVLGGVSPDYAVIAQKIAAPKLLQLTDEPFQMEYGLSLEQLTTRYAQDEVRDLLHANWLKNEWECSQEKIRGLELELETIYESKSWRLTQPVRKLHFYIKHVFFLKIARFVYKKMYLARLESRFLLVRVSLRSKRFYKK